MSEYTPGPVWIDDIREWALTPSPQKCDRCGQQIRYDRVKPGDYCTDCRDMINKLKSKEGDA